LKACRRCRALVKENRCKCGETSLSAEWHGYLIVEDPERSEIAERLSIRKPGKYALRVR
jgi:DNA-directed RNA polymerase subunit E"